MIDPFVVSVLVIVVFLYLVIIVFLSKISDALDNTFNRVVRIGKDLNRYGEMLEAIQVWMGNREFSEEYNKWKTHADAIENARVQSEEDNMDKQKPVFSDGMATLRNEVDQIVPRELELANKKFPQFHSAHEGWAVILEEVTEAEVEMETIRGNIDGMFDLVRNNVDAKWVAEKMEYAAINLACEAIQVAAMCRKFLNLEGNP